MPSGVGIVLVDCFVESFMVESLELLMEYITVVNDPSTVCDFVDGSFFLLRMRADFFLSHLSGLILFFCPNI